MIGQNTVKVVVSLQEYTDINKLIIQIKYEHGSVNYNKHLKERITVF